MTAPTVTPAAGPPPPGLPPFAGLPTPPLLRRPDDRVLRGVCAAVGRTTGTDPVLWRVALGVLTVFGGSGLLLYLAGWLLIPEEGADGSLAERVLRGRDLSRAGVIALVLGGAVLLGVVTGDGSDAAPVVAVALLAYVVLRRIPQGSLGSAAGPVVDGSPPGTPPMSAASSGWSTTAASPGWSVPVTAPRPVRPRSSLGLLTVSAALLVVGALLGLHAAGTDGITVGRLLAAALLVVGAGLLVGARWGRSRGLIALAVLLAVGLGVTSSARVPVSLSAGTRTWSVTGSADHELGVGHAVLDLRPLGSSPDPATTVTARLGAGSLRLLVPAGLHLRVTAHVTAGQVTLPGEPLVDGTDLQVVRTYGPDDAPLVEVTTTVGAGEVEVSRVAS